MNSLSKILLLAFAMVSLSIGEAIAEIKMPSIFGDHMVLQQQTSVSFWGSASKGSTVTIKTSWNGKSYSVRTDGTGKWRTDISTPTAGGPYTITVSDGSIITFKDVLIGEVWVCSGQSNMEMTMKGYYNQPVSGSNEYIATSSNDQIRLITIAHTISRTPSEVMEDRWLPCEPANVAGFSATAYFFGRFLNTVLKVPVGLICASWGGTRIEPWMTAPSLAEFDWVTIPNSDEGQDKINNQSPSVLFNGMINPFTGFGIKGVIWYQGEANRLEHERYLRLFPAMIKGWRETWDIGDFPFYFVQIAPYDYGSSGISSAYIREVQSKIPALVTNTGMACIMDTGEKNNIHPSNKKAAGERLAYQALVKTYSVKGIACDGPSFKSMSIEGNNVKLSFSNAPNGLTSYGKELGCFEVAGENRRFYPAIAVISGPGVSLFSPWVSNPVAVRYAFKDFIEGDLFNTEGLPATSFRTDDWDD